MGAFTEIIQVTINMTVTLLHGEALPSFCLEGLCTSGAALQVG